MLEFSLFRTEELGYYKYLFFQDLISWSSCSCRFMSCCYFIITATTFQPASHILFLPASYYPLRSQVAKYGVCGCSNFGAINLIFII